MINKILFIKPGISEHEIFGLCKKVIDKKFSLPSNITEQTLVPDAYQGIDYYIDFSLPM